MQIFNQTHISSLVCILFASLYPYVSMGIVACLGQLLAIKNVWTDWFLIRIIVGNIHQPVSFVDQWEWRFNLVCIPFCTVLRILTRDQHPFYLLLAEWQKFSSCTEYSCEWFFLWWQFLTIIFMVIGTILIIHSSTTSYNLNWLLHLMLVRLLSKFSHINHVYSSLYYPCVA